MFSKAVFGFVILLAATLGCASAADMEEVKRNQEKILAKLDKVGNAAPARARRPGSPDPAKTYAIPVGNSPSKGPENAWVTIVEVSDFQCPFCKRVNPTLKQVQDKFGNDVRIVFKHNPLPFHKRAMPAAAASMCAHDQGKFWEMHDKLFNGQRQLEDTNLQSYAKELGLNMGNWQKCYDGKKHEKSILADQKTATSFGARGTPAFFINGRFLSGAQPFPAFEALIKEELDKAKGSGISRDKYYSQAVVGKGSKKI